MRFPSEIHLSCGAPAELAAVDGDAAMRRCDMLAYTGALVDMGWLGQVVYDIVGCDTPQDGVMPLLRQHDGLAIAGQSDRVEKSADGLRVKGSVYLDTPSGREVCVLSDHGFRWQASVGLRVNLVEDLDEGKVAEVNGQRIEGPCMIVRRSTLKEASFVPLGRDANTRAVALADSPTIEIPLKREAVMAGTTQAAPSVDEVRAAESRRITELSEVFKGDPAFALKAISTGWSLIEAKAHLADDLQAKLAEQAKAMEALKEQAAKADKAARSLRQPIAVGRSGEHRASEGETPSQRWHALVVEIEAKGTPRTEAVRLAARQDPEAHEAYLTEINRGRTAADYKLREGYASRS